MSVSVVRIHRFIYALHTSLLWPHQMMMRNEKTVGSANASLICTYSIKLNSVFTVSVIFNHPGEANSWLCSIFCFNFQVCFYCSGSVFRIIVMLEKIESLTNQMAFGTFCAHNSISFEKNLQHRCVSPASGLCWIFFPYFIRTWLSDSALYHS